MNAKPLSSIDDHIGGAIFMRLPTLVILLCLAPFIHEAAAQDKVDPREYLLLKLQEAMSKPRESFSSSAPIVSTNGSGTNAPYFATTPPDYGCALWLAIAYTNESNVLVTINNTIPGTNYALLSKTNLNDAIWTTETNVIGTSGEDRTQVTIPMLGRSNLFFVASVARGYSLATNFAGLTQLDIDLSVADTMGAVGPNHFVELINGRIAVFDKSNGALLEHAHITNFFAYGTFVVDPRILYDHHSERWLACAIDINSGNAVLAVTTNSNPLGVLTNWIKHRLYVARAGQDTDFTTLGLDGNGIYLTVHHRKHGAASTNAGHTIVAMKKPEIYQGTLFTNYFDIDTELTDLKVWTVQPSVNFDPVPTNAYAWLIAKGPPDLGTNYRGGALLFRRLQWSNTTARLVDTNWQAIAQSSNVTYRDYYDADGTNILTRPTTTWLSAPQSNSTTRISLTDVGSRLMNAVVREGFLYVCHHVGLSGTNGLYTGNQFGTNADRSAAQWIKLRVEAETLSYHAHGRIYDAAPTSPTYYYFPSIAVNCAGDMLLGFSGSGATSYVGGYYGWRPAAGTVAETPVLFRAGDGAYPESRLGDYSATTLDPVDSTSFWTIQEYTITTTEFGPTWATWVAHVRLR